MFRKPLPLLRLAIYVIGIVVCGSVAGRETFYALAGVTTTGTIVTVGRYVSKGSGRTSGFWGEYEYFDADNVRHVGRADSFSFLPNGVVSPTAHPGDAVDIQFLRHAPQMSRLVPSPLGGLCFGSVALLAAVVFVAEIVVRRRRGRRRAQNPIDPGDDLDRDGKPQTDKP
jgi:hypothetical protein